MGIDAEPPVIGSAAKVQCASSRLPTGGQEARQALKADIDRRVQELVTLKRRFNADVCAILLPDELLLEIFLYYVAWWKVTYSNESFFRSYMSKKGHHGWVIITHVCHRWRVLALSAPAPVDGHQDQPPVVNRCVLDQEPTGPSVHPMPGQLDGCHEEY